MFSNTCFNLVYFTIENQGDYNRAHYYEAVSAYRMQPYRRSNARAVDRSRFENTIFGFRRSARSL